MGARALVTDRSGGVSMPPYDTLNLGAGVGDGPVAVAGNRRRLGDRAGLPADRIVWMQQVHGTRVARVSAAGEHPEPATDAMVSATVGLGLAVLMADCVPVLAADPAAGVIGVAHAGRLGAAAGIARELARAMFSLGAVADRMAVHLGPAICGRCYEVPAKMRDEVEWLLPGSACRTSDGTPGLDLRAGLHRQLTDLGFGPPSPNAQGPNAPGQAGLTQDPRCTREDATLFSHRRGSPTGRLAALVWLPRSDGRRPPAPEAPASARFSSAAASGVSYSGRDVSGR